MQQQFQQKAQALAAQEATRLHEMTRFLHPTIAINTSNTPPSNREKLWVTIGEGILTNSMPYSHLQNFTNISHVISKTLDLEVSDEWDPVLTELQLRSAELLFEFGCNIMSIANAKEVLKRHPKNARALRVVKDVRALSQ